MTTQQALARKWRPKSFQAMVGQQHVLQALINALTQKRLHHAYLFTGTRGVGKTSLARILAKCLNCETGITPEPCGVCAACQAIDKGVFIDLIEVDAASKTKVEDTRELLDNVQYLPTVGRYKIYLIDEVHMLSGHSFNALLKTLEEPPAHVIFLLATTDPHKLPVTVLSRCLQFHLKHLSEEAIAKQLTAILNAEHIKAEAQAIDLIAQAAQGSMRDGLSLLDQAIAFGAGSVLTEQVRTLLGSIDPSLILNTLNALLSEDAAALLDIASAVSEENGDFEQALKQLGKAFHDLTVLQTLGDKQLLSLPAYTYLSEFMDAFTPEDLQLYYQIALNGCRDLRYAPNLRTGFEMSLLRMLVFRPKDASLIQPRVNNTKVKMHVPAPILEEEPPYIEHVKMEPPPRALEPAPALVRVIDPAPIQAPVQQVSPGGEKGGEKGLPLPWDELITRLNLAGMGAALASHCVLKSYDGHHMVCSLSPKHAPLHNPTVADRIAQALSQYLGHPLTFQVSIEEVQEQTPAEVKAELTEQAYSQASASLASDPVVQGLKETFGAKIDERSITIGK